MEILPYSRCITVNNPIRENASVNISGQAFIIKSMQVDLKDIVLRGKGGVERVIDFQEFYNALAEGTIKIPGLTTERNAKCWEPSEYAEAIFRRDIVKLLDKDEYRQATDAEQAKMLQDFGVEHQKRVPTLKTIRKYQKKYLLRGFEGLIPKFSARGGRGWQEKSGAKKLAQEVILATYAKDDKLNFAATARLVADHFKCTGDASAKHKISSKTVSRIIRELPRDIVLNGRIDPRTYRFLSRQAVNEFYVEHAFELVQIDAKTVDMYVVDEFGRRYSKITLYAMVDTRTGYPIGIYMTAGPPSEYTLLKLFEFFFSPKNEEFKARFELISDWPAPCGLNKVLLDNAVENAAGVSLEIVRDLGIDIHYARAYRGDDKPYVESLFKALDDYVFNRMPGSKVSAEKGIKNRHARAEREACYTVEQVYKDVVQFIADRYVHEPVVKLGFRHRKNMTIKQAMDEELKLFMPPPPPAIEQVQRLILHKNKTTRTVQHYGIDFEGFQYNSYGFSEVTRDFLQKPVTILFNPSECAAIYAVDPRSGELIRLDCKMRDVPNVPFDVVKDIRKHYERDPQTMNGHDYHRVYARLLNKWTKDSQRRMKISDNNRLGQKKAREGYHQEVKTQLDQHVMASGVRTVTQIDTDDDFAPALREGI